MCAQRKKPVNLDYIDVDVAYLLGLVFARGKFLEQGDVRRLIIQFPYRNTALPTGTRSPADRETAIRLGLDTIRKRIEELLESNVVVERSQHMVTLRAVFTRATIGWRDLRFLVSGRNHYTDFELPDLIYDAGRDIQVEFMRGFADASSDPNPADADQQGHHRVVLQVQFGNWRLPVQICRLLQENLGIAVSHVLWGHPNLRAPKGGSGWAKETRIRIFAEDFEPIGYYFQFKQDAFRALVKKNKRHSRSTGRFCNPKAKKVSAKAKKPRHKDEDDKRLPPEIKGCHFNAYFRICKRLGCKKGEKPPQMEFFEDEELA